MPRLQCSTRCGMRGCLTRVEEFTHQAGAWQVGQDGRRRRAAPHRRPHRRRLPQGRLLRRLERDLLRHLPGRARAPLGLGLRLAAALLRLPLLGVLLLVARRRRGRAAAGGLDLWQRRRRRGARQRRGGRLTQLCRDLAALLLAALQDARWTCQSRPSAATTRHGGPTDRGCKLCTRASSWGC